MSSSSNKKEYPRGVKGGAIDLPRGSTREQDEANLLDAEDSQDSPWPIPAAAVPDVLPNNAAGFGPDFKDQARNAPPPAASASNRPANNKTYLPDFKDQVRSVRPPAAAQGSGNPKPAAAFKQGGEQDGAVAPRDQPLQPQQQQEPQAPPPDGGNGQDPSVTPFAQGVPVDNTEALDGGGVANPQTTVIRKHMIWAVALVVLGTVVAVVVAVVVALTINSSSGSGEGPTPSTTESPTASMVVLSENSKLTAIDGAAGDWFGFSVAIAGDTIVVGASDDDDNGFASGSVYVFTRTGTIWTAQTKLTASDGANFDQFGFSVAIAGDTIVVGAHGMLTMS